jgi:tetratricopeptide (TPR) repeat protein
MKEPADRDRVWDGYNYRRGQQLLRHPLTGAEVLIVKAGNELLQKKYSRAIELYNEGFRKAGGNADIELRALYGIQQAQFDGGMFSDAVETSSRVLALQPVNETWIIPHAWFKLGQIYARQGKMADARTAFGRVGDYDDYDFQERLERQVEEEMKKLEQEK